MALATKFKLGGNGVYIAKNMTPGLVELANPVHVLAQLGHVWPIQVNTYMTEFLYA